MNKWLFLALCLSVGVFAVNPRAKPSLACAEAANLLIKECNQCHQTAFQILNEMKSKPTIDIAKARVLFVSDLLQALHVVVEYGGQIVHVDGAAHMADALPATVTSHTRLGLLEGVPDHRVGVF